MLGKKWDAEWLKEGRRLPAMITFGWNKRAKTSLAIVMHWCSESRWHLFHIPCFFRLLLRRWSIQVTEPMKLSSNNESDPMLDNINVEWLSKNIATYNLPQVANIQVKRPCLHIYVPYPSHDRRHPIAVTLARDTFRNHNWLTFSLRDSDDVSELRVSSSGRHANFAVKTTGVLRLDRLRVETFLGGENPLAPILVPMLETGSGFELESGACACMGGLVWWEGEGLLSICAAG